MAHSPPGSVPVATSNQSTDSLCQIWYEEHGRAVYSYFRFHLPSPDIAEDLTADTFLKVFHSATRYDPAKGQVRPWIIRIAQNTLRDHLRKQRLRQFVPLGALGDLESDSPSPEERLLWEEQVSRLLASIAVLGPKDRELISLRFGSGLDNAEVAEMLGIREAAVRTRLWRALERLREVMAEDGS